MPKKEKTVRCPKCHGRLIKHNETLMRYLEPEFYGENDTAVKTVYCCERCGRYLEIIDPEPIVRAMACNEYWEKQNV